jgi:TolA-binding protein
MKKFVVAGMLCLATVAGVGQSAHAASLFGWHVGNKSSDRQPQEAPVIRRRSTCSRPVVRKCASSSSKISFAS